MASTKTPPPTSKKKPGRNKNKRIVITGISSHMGLMVAKRLHRVGDWDVVGIDRHETDGLPKDIEHLQVDLRSRRARDVFRQGEVVAVIHLGLVHNVRSRAEQLHQWNVLGTARLLEYCQEYKVPKVVILSSAEVYGPRADNQQFLKEDAPLMGAMNYPQIRDLVEADMQATAFFWRARESQTETVVLRPVHILGQIDNAASNYLRLPRVPVVMGFDPMVQVIHENDVMEAVCMAIKPGIHGVFNITGPGEVPLSVLLAELRRPTYAVPGTLFEKVMKVLWKFRLSQFTVPELHHLRYVGMVDGRRALEVMGFRPKYSLKEAVRAVEEHDDLVANR
jgi:UDP-glucose 4-epimerase